MASGQPKPVKEFENALQRLGWLSAYSRQILITRHLLRSFAAISRPADVPDNVPEGFALDHFRCAITVLSGVNLELQKFSSPYDPPNRPDTHYLAYRRKERIFSASIASGMPQIAYYFGAGSSIGFENSTEISVADGLFCLEIRAVAKNVGLTTKGLADRRAEALRNEKLWRDLPSEEESDATRFFDNWNEWSGKNGAFWREWYQGFLDGKPIDWELQRRVALIDDVIWEAGPQSVAEEIERIRARFDLAKRIEALEVDLKRATRNRHGIGGNMPPEEIEGVLIAPEMAIVSEPLEDLSDEVAKDDPDPEQLQKIIEMLVAALKKGFAWCLKKGDLMVDTAIKWAIPAGGTGYLTLNPEKLEAVIDAAKKLLSVL